MLINKTNFRGLLILIPKVFEDDRGWFLESYNKKALEDQNFYCDFVQDNHSLSLKKNTLRGLHFQNYPYSQAKIVRCSRGSVLDVVVDLRKGSDTYLQNFSIVLSAENKKMLFIPEGFAHGFVTLEDNTEIQYKNNHFYNKECDRNFKYNDSAISVDWGTVDPILSQKDASALEFANCDCNLSIKVLVTGANGRLAKSVVKKFESMGINVLGISRDDCDLANESESKRVVLGFNPDIIVHCAAYTDVDKAELDHEKCYRDNVIATKNIALCCNILDAKLIDISSTYVYSGDDNEFSSVDDLCQPLNYYGNTKLHAENECQKLVSKLFIIRTNWLYGDGNNFIRSMIKLSQVKNQIEVVSDQIGYPTCTSDLADFICFLAFSKHFGIYNFTGAGEPISYFDYAKFIFSRLGKNVKVLPVFSKNYNAVATRPLNGRLNFDCVEKLGYNIPLWKDSVSKFIKENFE